MKIKKIFSLFLALALMLSVLGSYNTKASAQTNNYFECNYPNRGGYIWGFDLAGNTLGSVKQGFSGNSNLTVTAVNHSGTALADTDKIGNDATIKVLIGGAEAASYKTYLLGDPNYDGSVDSSDMLLLKQSILKIKTLAGSQAVAANLNQDAGIDASDLLKMKKALLKLDTIVQQYIPSDVSFTAKTYNMADAMQYVKVNGRSVAKGTSLTFDWSSSGFETNLFCEGDISLTVNATGYANYAVIVDNNISNVTKIDLVWGDNTNVIAKGLQKGYHKIKVYKRTEAAMGATLIKSISFNGQFEAKPAVKPLKIELYGDSITCGAWDEVLNGQTSGLIYQYCEDPGRSYGADTANDLHAEYNIIAASGWGVYTGNGNAPNSYIPRVWDNTTFDGSIKWDFNNYIPDVVVVNLGGNDASAAVLPTATQFETAYKNFITNIRSKYPNAYIFCVDGMVGYKTFNPNIINSVNALSQTDSKISYLQLPKNIEGGGMHPTIEGHRAAADVLTAAIKQKLNIQ